MVVLQEIEQEVNSRVYDIWYIVVSYLSVSRCFSLDTDMWCCSYLSAFYVLLCDWWFFWYILITCLLPQSGLLDTLTQIQIKLMQNNLMRLKQWTYYFYFPSHLSPLSLSVRTFTASLPFTSSLFLFTRDQNRNESSAVLDVHWAP